jgi:pectin methylesterase-like acyl-CoA thioesterase
MNKYIVLVLLLFSLMASGIITIQPIKADSRTIIVPDDYATIAAAIGNATDGDTIFIKAGTYEEHTLVINKTLAL